MARGLNQVTAEFEMQPQNKPSKTPNQIRLPSKSNKSTIFNIILLSHLALVALHVGINSSPVLIAIFTAVSITGLLRLTRQRIWPSDMFLIFLSLYSGTAALVSKGVVSQTLQENLVYPVYSATVLLAGFLSMMIAASVAELIVSRTGTSRVIKTFSDPQFSGNLAVIVFSLGLIIFIVNIQIRPQLINGRVEEGAGFGGLGSLYFILILGVSMIFHQWRQGGKKRYFFLLVAVGLGMFLLSFASNTKKEFADFTLVILLGYFAFLIRPNFLVVSLSILAVLMMYLYVAPLIHLTRQAAPDLGPLSRMELAWDVLRDHQFSFLQLAESERRFFSGFVYTYGIDNSYLYPLTGQVDRFTLIFPIDQVARGTQAGYLMGLSPFLSEVKDLLPSVFVTKTAAVGSDLMAWFYGFRGYGVFGRPVVGFTASALAAGGFIMVVFLSFFISLPVLAFLNWGFGHLRQSPLAMSAMVFGWTLPERSIDTFIAFGLRNALLFWLFALMLTIFYNGLKVQRSLSYGKLG